MFLFDIGVGRLAGLENSPLDYYYQMGMAGGVRRHVSFFNQQVSADRKTITLTLNEMPNNHNKDQFIAELQSLLKKHEKVVLDLGKRGHELTTSILRQIHRVCIDSTGTLEIKGLNADEQAHVENGAHEGLNKGVPLRITFPEVLSA